MKTTQGPLKEEPQLKKQKINGQHGVQFLSSLLTSSTGQISLSSLTKLLQDPIHAQARKDIGVVEDFIENHPEFQLFRTNPNSEYKIRRTENILVSSATVKEDITGDLVSGLTRQTFSKGDQPTGKAVSFMSKNSNTPIALDTTSPQYEAILAERSILPAFRERKRILEVVEKSSVSIITGETGSGKSTQVPQIILDHHIENQQNCSILVAQPRRIAATSLAERYERNAVAILTTSVAHERAEKLAQSVGYQIRFKYVASEMTRIMFITQGILFKRLQYDPTLTGITHVIVDEVHEREVLTDFSLLVLRNLILGQRPDLKLILMSATISTETFIKYFTYSSVPCHIHLEGYSFPVNQHFLEDIIKKIEYKPTENYRKASGQGGGKSLIDLRKSYPTLDEETIAVLNHVESLRQDGKVCFDLIKALIAHIHTCLHEGAILVFVPGWQEISTLHKMLSDSPHAAKWELCPVHSQVSFQEQQKIFEHPPPGKRKIVIATNICETSLTINDVSFVVDSGLIKEKGYSTATNISSLLSVEVSMANLLQRKGRAGRVKEGYSYHLITQASARKLPQEQTPEMRRTPVEQLCMYVKGLELGSVEAALGKTLSPPDPQSIHHAITLLKRLGALDDQENLTLLGSKLCRLPVHPQLGKMLLAAAFLGCVDPILTIISGLGFRSPFNLIVGQEKEMEEVKTRWGQGTHSDHLTLAKVLRAWKAASRSNSHNFCWSNFLSQPVLTMIDSMRSQFRTILTDELGVDPGNLNSNQGNDEVVKAALASGLYPNLIYCDFQKKTHKISGTGLAVSISKSSTNSDIKTLQTAWLLFYEITKTQGGISCRETTCINPGSLMLCCGSIDSVPHVNGTLVNLGLNENLLISKDCLEPLQILNNRFNDCLVSQGAKNDQEADRKTFVKLLNECAIQYPIWIQKRQKQAEAIAKGLAPVTVNNPRVALHSQPVQGFSLRARGEKTQVVQPLPRKTTQPASTAPPQVHVNPSFIPGANKQAPPKPNPSISALNAQLEALLALK